MVLAITAMLQGMSVKLRDAEGATLLQKAWGTEQEMPVNVLAFLFCLTLQLNFPRPWVILQDICLFLVLSFPTPRVDSVLEIYISSSQLVSGQAHAFWDVEMRAETNAITSLSKSPRQICFQMLSFGFSPSSCIYINLVFLFMQRSGCTWRNEYRSAGAQNGVDREATHSGRIPILKLITEKGGNLNAKAKRGGILSSTVSREFNSLKMSCCLWAAMSKVARGIELDVCIQVLWYKL